MQDADEVLKSLGKEGSLDFVAEDDMKLDKKGNPQYTKTVCTGKHIKKAEAGTQQNEVTKNKEYVVELSFNAKGTKLFADATKAAYPTKKKIYIVYDGKVLSAPNVQAEITDGKAVISGSFDTYDKAEELASMIRIGALPVELKEIQSQVVGAQLGQDAIQTSLLARCNRFCSCSNIYACILQTSGTCSFYSTCFLPRADACSIKRIEYNAYTSGCGRYHT